MDISKYPKDVQKYINELAKRGILNIDGIEDKMLINYLHTQKFDEDYVKSHTDRV